MRVLRIVVLSLVGLVAATAVALGATLHWKNDLGRPERIGVEVNGRRAVDSELG